MAGGQAGRVGVPWCLRQAARRELTARLSADIADVIGAGAEVEHPAVRMGSYAVALRGALLLKQGHTEDAAVARREFSFGDPDLWRARP